MGIFDLINEVEQKQNINKYDNLNTANDNIDNLLQQDRYEGMLKGAKGQLDYSTINEAFDKPMAMTSGLMHYIAGDQKTADERLQQALSFEQEHAGGSRGSQMFADAIGGLAGMALTGGGATFGQLTATGLGKMLVNQEAKRLAKGLVEEEGGSLIGKAGRKILKAVGAGEENSLDPLAYSIAKQDAGLETALRGGVTDSFAFTLQQPEAYTQIDKNGNEHFGIGANTVKAFLINKLFFTVPAGLGALAKKGINRIKIAKRIKDIRENGGIVKINGISANELLQAIDKNKVTHVNDINSNEGTVELDNFNKSTREGLLYDNNGNFRLRSKMFGDVEGKFINNNIIIDTNKGKMNPLLTIVKFDKTPLIDIVGNKKTINETESPKTIGEMIDSGSEVKTMFDKDGKISDWAKDFDAKTKGDLKGKNVKIIEFDNLNKLNTAFDKIEEAAKQRGINYNTLKNSIRVKKTKNNKYILTYDNNLKNAFDTHSFNDEIILDEPFSDEESYKEIVGENVDPTEGFVTEQKTNENILNNEPRIKLAQKLNGKNKQKIKDAIVNKSIENLKNDLTPVEKQIYDNFDNISNLDADFFGFTNDKDFKAAKEKVSFVKEAEKTYAETLDPTAENVSFDHIGNRKFTIKEKREYEKNNPHHILIKTNKKEGVSNIYDIYEPIVQDFEKNKDVENIKTEDVSSPSFNKEQSVDIGKTNISKALEKEPQTKTEPGKIDNKQKVEGIDTVNSEPLHSSLFKKMFYKVKNFFKSKKAKKNIFDTKYSPVSKKQLIKNLENELDYLNGKNNKDGAIIKLKEKIKKYEENGEPPETIEKLYDELAELSDRRDIATEHLEKLNDEENGDAHYNNIVKQYIAYDVKKLLTGAREYASLKSVMFDILKDKDITGGSIKKARKALFELKKAIDRKIYELEKAKGFYSKKNKGYVKKLPDDINAYIDEINNILKIKSRQLETLLKSDDNIRMFLEDRFLHNLDLKEKIEELNAEKDFSDVEWSQKLQNEISKLYSQMDYGEDAIKQLNKAYEALSKGETPNINFDALKEAIQKQTDSILDDIELNDIQYKKKNKQYWTWFKESAIIKFGKNAKDINPLKRPEVRYVEDLSKEHETLNGVRGVSIDNVIAIDTTLTKDGRKHLETINHEVLHYLNKFYQVDGIEELAEVFRTTEGIKELIPEEMLYDDDEVIAYVLGKLFTDDMINHNNIFKGFRENRISTSKEVIPVSETFNPDTESLDSAINIAEEKKANLENKLKNETDNNKIKEINNEIFELDSQIRKYKFEKEKILTQQNKKYINKKENEQINDIEYIQTRLEEIKDELKDLSNKIIDYRENPVYNPKTQINLMQKALKQLNELIDERTKLEEEAKKYFETQTNGSYDLKNILTEEQYAIVKKYRRLMYDIVNSSPELKGAYFDDIPTAKAEFGSEIHRKTIAEATIKTIREKFKDMAKEIDTMSIFDVFYYTQDRLALEKIASMKQGYENFVQESLVNIYKSYMEQMQNAVGDDLKEFDYHIGRAIQNGLHHIIDDLKEITYNEIKEKTKANHNIGYVIVKKIKKAGGSQIIKEIDPAIIIDKFIDNIAKEKFGSKWSNKFFSYLSDGTKRSSLSGTIPKNSLEIVQMMRKMFDNIDKTNIDYVAMIDKEIAKRRLNHFFKNNKKSFIKKHLDILNKHFETTKKMSADWKQHEDLLIRHGAYGNQFGVNPELQLQNFDYRVKLVAKVKKGQRVIKKYKPTKKGTNGMYLVLEESPDLKVAGQDSVFAGFVPENHDKGIYTAYLEGGSVKKLKNGKYAIKTYIKGKEKWTTIDTKEIAVRYDQEAKKYKVFTRVPINELEKSQIFNANDNVISTRASDMYKKNHYIMINEQAVKHWRRNQIKVALDDGILIRPDEYHSLDPDLKNQYYKHTIKDFGIFYSKKRFKHHISGTAQNDLRRFTKIFGKNQKWINANIVRPLLGAVETLRGLVLTYNLGSYINSAASSYATYFIHASKPHLFKEHIAKAQQLLQEYKQKLTEIANEAIEKNIPIQQLIKKYKLDKDVMHYAMTNGIGQTIRQAAYDVGTYKENRLMKTIRPMFNDVNIYNGIKNWWATPDSAVGNALGNIFDKTEMLPKLASYIDGLEAGLTKEQALQKVINAYPNYGMNLHPVLKHLDLISPYTKYTMQFPKLFISAVKQSPIRLYGTLAMFHASLYGSYALNNGLDKNHNLKKYEQWFYNNDLAKIGDGVYYYMGSLLPYIPPISTDELTRISILGSIDKLLFPIDLNPFTFVKQ